MIAHFLTNSIIAHFLPNTIVRMLQVLLATCEDQNADGFSEAVAEYDKISRLDQWHTTLLLRVKKSIEGDVDLR